MIRDSDGKNPEELAGQFCRYYSEQNQQDIDKLPRVRRQNILILKWKQYLHRLVCGQHLTEILGKEIDSVSDLKEHFEELFVYFDSRKKRGEDVRI